MKSFIRRVDRFCYTHPRFGIQNLIIYIIIANAAVWIFARMDTTHTLTSLLSFSAEAVFTKGQVWRLITFVFIPQYSSIVALALMLYFYYFVGKTLEKQWGAGKFTIYYLCGMVVNILYGTLMWLLTGNEVAMTGSYINLSLFFAFATLFPDMIVLLFFIIPIKIKWLAYVSAAFFVFEMIITPFPANLLPLVALLNYFLFCGGWLIDLVRPARLKQKKNTINFKKAAKKYQSEQAKKPYNRKCEVCGRTDTENPGLEFRFCSTCGGYHCFCTDHINSHIHFKD